jgi:predicted Zn-ribbon and HTH transcriptional regulator
MGKLLFSEIARLCPHCASENIESEPQWKDLDAHSGYLYHCSTKVSLDNEGENYLLYFFKCSDCGTSFCIKRLDTQTC